MKTIRLSCLFLFLIVVSTPAADGLVRREWKVEDVTREALVYVPPNASTQAAPVVFAFHGHGGSMNNAARMFSYHTRWPEAVVVYMQGLNTPGRLSDPEGNRPGWQRTVGDQGDRDLKFFDAVLESLKKDYRVDEKRIYSTGHSNGGAFTYLLWAARGDRFAAFAPSAAAAAGQDFSKFKPKPVLHVAGKNDPLVKFEWQERTIDALRRVNQCGEGETDKNGCTVYASKVNAPVVALIHPGTHAFLQRAPEIIVKFFQEHPQP